MRDDQRKRIVLIDDHVLVREGLERLLNLGDEFVVCEDAGDADRGMEMVREMHPDAAVVDIQLPGADGIELTKQLLDEFPHLVIVTLSASEDPEMVLRAMDAGAMAYVAKSEGIEALRTALRNAFNHRRSFSLLEKFGRIV
jgi:DNA-binding NarL/FixJ family response regulator